MTNWEKDFNGRFMNNGVNGILDDKFQDQKLLLVKDFISSLLEQQKKEIIEEVKENQKGQFENDAGNICWYLDDLIKMLKNI